MDAQEPVRSFLKAKAARTEADARHFACVKTLDVGEDFRQPLAVQRRGFAISGRPIDDVQFALRARGILRLPAVENRAGRGHFRRDLSARGRTGIAGGRLLRWRVGEEQGEGKNGEERWAGHTRETWFMKKPIVAQFPQS